MTIVRRFALVFALFFAVGSTTGCIVHLKGTKRAGNSCGKNKVWVKHKGKLKCKHRHFKRGKKNKGVKTRDHRKKK